MKSKQTAVRLTKILLIIFICSGMFVQAQYEDAILWSSDFRLSWSDFEGNPPGPTPAAAITASGISYQFSTVESEGPLELDYTVSTHFYPSKSWYQPKLCDDNILSHEQLHFDISELFARKMRKLMERTTFTNNVKEEVRAIYSKINSELAEFQNRYDEETNFSRNREKQLEWNEKIAAALKE